jgi:YVTN family beta-propeller protein
MYTGTGADEIAFDDPTHNRMYVAGDFSNGITAIATNGSDVVNTNIIDRTIRLDAGSGNLAFDSTHNRMYVASKDRINVFDTNTSTVGIPIVLAPFLQGIAFDSLHDRMYVTIYNEYPGDMIKDTVTVIDTNDNVVIASHIKVGHRPEAIAFDLIHDRMYVANREKDYYGPADIVGTVSVIDTNTNTVVGLPIEVGYGPYRIAYVPPQP